MVALRAYLHVAMHEAEIVHVAEHVEGRGSHIARHHLAGQPSRTELEYLSVYARAFHNVLMHRRVLKQIQYV